MSEITIHLEEPMKAYVDAQLTSGQFTSAKDFFEYLLREDQRRRGREQLAKMVAEAEASGKSEEITSAYWEGVRKAFQEKYGQGQSA